MRLDPAQAQGADYRAHQRWKEQLLTFESTESTKDRTGEGCVCDGNTEKRYAHADDEGA
jgi:hypothetical protein